MRGEIPTGNTTVIPYNLSNGGRRRSEVSAIDGQASPSRPVE